MSIRRSPKFLKEIVTLHMKLRKMFLLMRRKYKEHRTGCHKALVFIPFVPIAEPGDLWSFTMSFRDVTVKISGLS